MPGKQPKKHRGPTSYPKQLKVPPTPTINSSRSSREPSSANIFSQPPTPTTSKNNTTYRNSLDSENSKLATIANSRGAKNDTKNPNNEDHAGITSNTHLDVTQNVLPTNNHLSSSIVPSVVTAGNSAGVAEQSHLTGDSALTFLSREMIMKYTHKFIFPKVKFFGKVSMDPLLQWNPDPFSLCQIVLRDCNLKFDNVDVETQQQIWFQARRFVMEKVTSLRSDKSSAIRKTFFGKKYTSNIVDNDCF